jgi:hypothetical protein
MEIHHNSRADLPMIPVGFRGRWKKLVTPVNCHRRLRRTLENEPNLRHPNQMLNGKIGETCNLQPAQAAQDVSLDERASVSQEHESPIHMRFRSPFGKIVTPILLDESLSGLWSQSVHDLLELCAHCPLPLTFNKNIILNRHTCQKTIAPEKEDRLMTSHVILVHWHSTDMVLSGAKPWLCGLESKKQTAHASVCTWRGFT